jgi:hypothetical protein
MRKRKAAQDANTGETKVPKAEGKHVVYADSDEDQGE